MYMQSALAGSTNIHQVSSSVTCMLYMNSMESQHAVLWMPVGSVDVELSLRGESATLFNSSRQRVYISVPGVTSRNAFASSSD
jgi:hypothetical protein